MYRYRLDDDEDDDELYDGEWRVLREKSKSILRRRAGVARIKVAKLRYVDVDGVVVMIDSEGRNLRDFKCCIAGAEKEIQIYNYDMIILNGNWSFKLISDDFLNEI